MQAAPVLLAALAKPAVIGTLGALTAGMSVLQGYAAYRGGQAEAARIAEARKSEEIVAAERAAAIARNIRATLGTHRALAAARGMDLGDPGTPLALEDALRAAGDRDLQMAELNRLTRMRELDLQRHEARSRGRAGLIGGLAGAATSLASTGLSLASIGGAGSLGGAATGAPRPLFPAGLGYS